MLKSTLKDHTEEDFIIPEEELNTQYHQIAYDYHNPKRLFNQSNVVILNKKQKKKLNKLQQEELMLQQLEQGKEEASISNPELNRQEQNKNRIDQYIKERMTNDNESNYQYLRQHQLQPIFSGSLSSTSQLIKNKDHDHDSDTNTSDSDSDSDIFIHNRINSNNNGPGNSVPESTAVEMYSPPNGTYPRRIYNSRFGKTNNVTVVDSKAVSIDMKNNNSLGRIGQPQPTYSVQPLQNTINLDTAAPLSTQKTKVLNYLDKLIKENKEKKQARNKEKQDHPERYNRNHPQEWFSQVMGVKEIQEERDAKIFVQAKQKREKEIMEQKMEKLKDELNYANTPEQVEAIFNELKALNENVK
ncbi:hypothetical protein PIROE2DRAFT_16394 [Piromyces sp. E2]|nr:hypothetical protein PIROE2DRAFT_16394 [Piromyces sp. E2]|eukprot:OUM58349.1 hypothetical protein PIROE2DRAFT_16394 [Piromyces sp. E2]